MQGDRSRSVGAARRERGLFADRGEAGALLGHFHYIDGRVTRGAGRGRTIGFPTANVETGNELLPPHGVYATTITIDGAVYRSITNVGVRPTFNESELTVETFVLNQVVSSGATAARLQFLRRLRREIQFESASALRHQIEIDIHQAQRFFRLLKGEA